MVTVGMNQGYEQWTVDLSDINAFIICKFIVNNLSNINAFIICKFIVIEKNAYKIWAIGAASMN